MRGFFRLIGLIIAAAIVAALAIFAAQNITHVPAQFFGMSFTGNLWWVCIGSAVLGFILAFLLLAPGRVAAGWRERTLGRERMRLQDELAAVRTREAQLRAEHEQLHTEHEELRAQHDQVAAERDQLRQGAASPVAAPVSAPLEPTPAESEPAPAASTPLVPPAQPVGAAATSSAAADHPPALGERLRDVFRHPQPPQPDEASYTQGPPVPTA